MKGQTIQVKTADFLFISLISPAVKLVKMKMKHNLWLQDSPKFNVYPSFDHEMARS